MDKILIVDDNPLDRELLREMLQSAPVKYDIQEAKSGREAMKLIDHEPPDVILLDIQMSDINGFTTLQKLKERQNIFVPVLLVSSFTGDNDRLKGIELGATDFINKPLVPEEVQARVAGQIRFKKMQDDARWVARETNEAIKLLYREMEKKNEELKRLDQLKSDFVSTVSHELRTPLAITTEGLSLVIDEITGPLNEKQREILKTSYENIGRLSRIINDLLDISKIEAGKIELYRGLVDFKQLLQDLIDSYQSIVKPKQITLTLTLPQDDICLYIDGDKMIQVMNNLLNNACKFTDKGGQITVEVKKKGSDYECCIRDSGIGIDQADIAKLFSKFHQIGRKDGPGIRGTGLGLVISQALVRLHGGEIWCESCKGEGTSFYYTLPSHEELRQRFEKDFDVLLQEANSAGKPCAFLVTEFINVDEMNKECGEKNLIDIINSRLAKTEDIMKEFKERVFLYDNHTIYVILPQTQRTTATLLMSRLKVALEKLQYLDQKDAKPEFRLGLAVFPQDAHNRTDLIAAARSHLFRQKTVLVVDDHPQIVRILELRLKSQGYQIAFAANGKQALEIIEQKRVNPDIIVLDIMMPEMNGYEVYGRLKENPLTSHIPVILLTAHDIDMGRIESITPGHVPIIQKTGGFENLIEVIDKY